MCDNCREATELAKDISEQMQTGERVREFYRRQGESRILERVRHTLRTGETRQTTMKLNSWSKHSSK